MHDAASYKNLVFSGGTVNVIGLLGALKAATEDGLQLSQIERVAGTSSGSLLALLVACGFEIDEIENIMLHEFKYTSVLTDPDLITGIPLHEGIFKLDHLMQFLENKLAQKFGDDHKDITFREIERITGKKLYVIATKPVSYVDSGGNRSSLAGKAIFSADSYADTPVANAIMASAAFPLFFEAIRMLKTSPTRWEIDTSGHRDAALFLDGGVLDNYPLTLFDDAEYIPPGASIDRKEGDCENPETLGFALYSIEQEKTEIDSRLVMESEPVTSLSGYLQALGDALFSTQMQMAQLPAKDHRRSVFVDVHGMNSFNFFMNDTQKAQLMEYGNDSYLAFKQRKMAKAVSTYILSAYPGTLLSSRRENRLSETHPAEIPARCNSL